MWFNLWPLVFLLYINDFREKVQGNFDIIQFFDDTSFHFNRNIVSKLEKCVSEILEKTDNYLKQNKLTMNTGKTELLCVSEENENFDPIVFRGHEIKPQSHCRYLGIMIDSKLNFRVQLNKVLSNMAAAIRSNIPYTLSVASESTIDAIQMPSPFSFNFQCSFFRT